MPIGAFLSKAHCQALVPGDHGSTFGGNALTTAAGYAGTKFLIDNDIPAHVKQMESYLLGRLNDVKDRFSIVTEVRGKGLLAAMDFDDAISGRFCPIATRLACCSTVRVPTPSASCPR